MLSVEEVDEVVVVSTCDLGCEPLLFVPLGGWVWVGNIPLRTGFKAGAFILLPRC